MKITRLANLSLVAATLAFGGFITQPVVADDRDAENHSAPKDIVGVAASNENFKTLVAAVKAAGLVETLQSKGPFTVFAPTDAAFAKLPKGTVEDLLKPE